MYTIDDSLYVEGLSKQCAKNDAKEVNHLPHHFRLVVLNVVHYHKGRSGIVYQQKAR